MRINILYSFCKRCQKPFTGAHKVFAIIGLIKYEWGARFEKGHK